MTLSLATKASGDLSAQPMRVQDGRRCGWTLDVLGSAVHRRNPPHILSLAEKHIEIINIFFLLCPSFRRTSLWGTTGLMRSPEFLSVRLLFDTWSQRFVPVPPHTWNHAAASEKKRRTCVPQRSTCQSWRSNGKVRPKRLPKPQAKGLVWVSGGQKT